MLSNENNPLDPLKSTVQHISSSGDGNTTGDKKSLPETQHHLISSSVEDHNFSIRDFVYSARNKDIVTNWPFPEKHLKLCLKHGVKELLPPFESKTSKRKPYFTFCLEKRSLVDDAVVTRIQDEEPSERVDCLTIHSSGDVNLTQETIAHHLEVKCDKPDKDIDFPSSDTSISQAYPSRGQSTFKRHRFPKTSGKSPSSKCKLIVKFSSPSVHSLNEEIMPHKTNTSDVPASKVCPVCKTFTSSSNTTLNAHIDQCLSMETTSEGMADSRITAKGKVKPRKMKSMVDIYATALVCTIEDLDRRNGSSWATDLSMPARNTDVESAKGNEKQVTSPSEPDKEDNDDGGVYFDANGRKIRILSKMDSFSSVVTTKEDNRSKKPQTSKTLMTSMKKHHGRKHLKDKYLERAISNEKLLAQNACSSQVLGPHKFLDDSMLPKGFRDAVKADTFKDRSTHQHPRNQSHNARHSTARIQKSRMGGVGVDRSSSKGFLKDSPSLSESQMRNIALDSIQISTKQCMRVKRTRSAISKDNKYYKMGTNVHKRLKKSTSTPQNQLNRFADGINQNRPSTANSSSSTKHAHHFWQKSAKLHKDYIDSSSERHAPKIWKGTLCFTNEEDQMQIEDADDVDVDSDENVATLRSESHVMHYAEPERTQNQQLTFERRINQLEKERGGVSSVSQDGALDVNTCDEFVDTLNVPLSGSKGSEHGRSQILTDPHKNFTAERIMRKFMRSIYPEYQERDDSDEYQSSPQASNDSLTGPNSSSSPPDPVLDEGKCKYNMELESEATAQGNPCSDIDPIPIPGPPGSFLPSPVNAGTEDYQGNSLLTGSLSPNYEKDDGNSSKSPTSSTSNLAAETSDKLAEKFPSPETNAVSYSSPLGFPIPRSVEVSKFPQPMKFRSTRSDKGDQKSYMIVQDENQHYYCSQKERVQRGSCTVDYQESLLLHRRTMSATMIPTKENTICSLNTAPSYSSAGSDIYLLSSSSIRAVNTSVLKESEGFASPKYPETMKAGMFHTVAGSESASPSAVLRLMGKNLMVTKNDESFSGSLGDDAAPSNTNTQMFRQKAASPGKPPSLRNLCPPFQSAVLQDPARNSSSYRSDMRHTFDLKTYNGGPWLEINSPRPGIPNHLEDALFDRQWPVQQHVPRNGYDNMPYHMQKGPSSSIDFRKAGSEANAFRNGVTGSNSLNYTGVSSSMAAAEHNQSRVIHPVYSPASSIPMYMQQVAGNTCFVVPFSSSCHSVNPLQVNNYPQHGSYVLHGGGGGGGPFMASSLSRSTHPRPGMFFSPKLP